MSSSNDLPSEKLLIAYWIADVGIGPSGKMQHVHVPLTDVLSYTLRDGSPQIKVVNLFNASFNNEDTFITIPDGILEVLTVQPGQSESQVRQLQNSGIKVLLSVMGNNGKGWDDIPQEQNEAFANAISTIVNKYGLDGIDIDNEDGGEPNPQGFMNTIGVLRHYLADKLITKALWNDSEYFKIQVSDETPYNAGKYLSELLDLGSTMTYHTDYEGQIGLIKGYNQIVLPNGQNVGMPYNRLCIGVEAQIPGDASPQVQEVAQWAASNILGIMLFTFSQDIQQFTHDPQNSIPYPNPNDHEFQKMIIQGMWSDDN